MNSEEKGLNEQKLRLKNTQPATEERFISASPVKHDKEFSVSQLSLLTLAFCRVFLF